MVFKRHRFKSRRIQNLIRFLKKYKDFVTHSKIMYTATSNKFRIHNLEYNKALRVLSEIEVTLRNTADPK